MAQAYLQKKKWLSRPSRFDVIAISYAQGPNPAIRWIRNAFETQGNTRQ